ncbi:MAG: hypothetical protein J6A59_01810 [Lachnospiraceae bacterium]|nr:hypothetical protein [Lachnospiraceae bacterium]
MIYRSNDSVYRDNDWLNIKCVLLRYGDMVISIDKEYIGQFRIDKFSEYYTIGFSNNIIRVRTADYMFLEIHRSQIGEIEYLYDTKKVYMVTMLFRDGHEESFVLNDRDGESYRITSKGDLRIEIGKSDIIRFNYMYVKEATPEHCFGCNYGEDMYSEKDKNIINLYNITESEMVSHDYVIEDSKNELKQILGEIIFNFNGKKLSTAKIIALACAVDVEWMEEGRPTLNIKKYLEYNTAVKKIENFRIQQFKFNDFKNCRVPESNSELREMVKQVCEIHEKDRLVEILNNAYFYDNERPLEELIILSK